MRDIHVAGSGTLRIIANNNYCQHCVVWCCTIHTAGLCPSFERVTDSV